MLPDRVSNPGPLTSQVPYRLRYAARLLIEVREFNLETYCFQDFFLDSFLYDELLHEKYDNYLHYRVLDDY